MYFLGQTIKAPVIKENSLPDIRIKELLGEVVEKLGEIVSRTKNNTSG